MNKENSLAVQAVISKISTQVDGSWRVSFDINLQTESQFTELAKFKEKALYLVIMENNDGNSEEKG